MTRDQLEHAIRAACDVSGDHAVYVFGSQAILGEHPNAPALLRQSIEVDLAPVTRVDQVDAIDGALGELSQFFQTHGFYVHGLPIDAVTLPTGWRDRVVTVRNSATYDYSGLCLEAHDLAASKLAAFRDKDREFVRVLLSERLINAATLTARLGSIEMAETERARRVQWVSLTATALDDTS